MKKNIFCLGLCSLFLLQSISLLGCDASNKPKGSGTENIGTDSKNQVSNSSSPDTGSNGGEKDKIKLVFSHFMVEEERQNNADNDIQLKQIEDFAANNPEVELVQQAMMHDDYQTKIQAQAAVNEMPDIFLVKGSWFNNFIDSDLVQPVDTLLEAYSHRDAYRDGIFDASQKDGKIYGLPIQFSLTSVVFYNQKLWEEAGFKSFPDNWEDIYKAADYFNSQNISPFALGNKDKWPAGSCWFSTLGDRYTGVEWTNSMIKKEATVKFTDPEFVKALEHFQQLNQKKIFNPDYNVITNQQADEYYGQGEAATLVSGYWSTSYLLANASEEVLGNTKIALLPGVESGKGETNATSGGAGWYVAVNSKLEGKKLEKAMELMLSISGYEYSTRLGEEYGFLGPCITDKIDASGFDPLVQDYLSTMSNVGLTPIYDILMEGSVIDIMNSGLQELLNGTITPEALGETIQKEQETYVKQGG